MLSPGQFFKAIRQGRSRSSGLPMRGSFRQGQSDDLNAMLARSPFCTPLAAVALALLCPLPALGAATQPVPDKLVVLTFDDAVKSHRTFVAPLLKELGFGATFFVTHKWMDDRTNFMTWQDIAEINEVGFEIGNHSWTHDDFSMPRNAARLAAELFLVDRALG